MSSKKTNIYTGSHYFLGVVSAFLLTLAPTQEAKAQDFEEFTTENATIKDSTTYILREENGWYMKAGYDATNRLSLLSTRKASEASPFYFRHWYGDIYFVSVQMDGDSKCFLSRNAYGTLQFFPGFAYEEERFGWDCSSGCMSISTTNHGWTSNYYLYCNNGDWDLDKFEMSTITMLQVTTNQSGGKVAGNSGTYTGIVEKEDKTSDHTIYTLSGAKVRGTPTRHGIYIVDGHKVAY